MIDICLLGTGGMMPLDNRYLTAMLARINGKMALIDCGEGTQMTMKLAGWGFKNLDIICFTHFHADHISGLPGLLLTIGNSARQEPVTIMGPKGLEEIVRSLLVIAPELPFDINFYTFSEENNFSYKWENCDINAIPLDHKLYCLGYNFVVNRIGKFDTKKAESFNLPKKYWNLLQKGHDVTFDGNTFTPSMVLGESRKGIKVSYCTDTRPIYQIVDFVKDSELFICEGIYGENEKKDKAISYKHMLFSEAATLAKNAQVKELWLTHYSPSLVEPKLFLKNATSIFENTFLGYDRMTKTFYFED